jgi:lipid-A-disaccharide synthase-like uncharacterized protein
VLKTDTLFLFVLKTHTVVFFLTSYEAPHYAVLPTSHHFFSLVSELLLTTLLLQSQDSVVAIATGYGVRV